jgi:cysteine desulfurase
VDQRITLSLDAHETHQSSMAVIERMQAALKEKSPHSLLDPLLDLVGAGQKDLFAFTHSGAEAINQVHWTAYLELARKGGKCHFLTTAVEEAATLQSLKRLETLGCTCKIAPLDKQGCVDLEKLPEFLTPRTALFSLSLASALTGVVQPIEEIVKMAHAAGTLVHVDATCALGKLYAPFQTGVDYLTFGGGGIHSVKGSGGVFAKQDVPLVPLIIGERSDPASFAALMTAATHAGLFFDSMNLEVARLRDRLEGGVRGATALFKECFRLPNVAVLTFPKIHQEMLAFTLRQKGVAVSLGGEALPRLYRHLQNAGFEDRTALTSCSFALSRFTTQEEIDRALFLINEVVHTLLPLTEDLFEGAYVQ